MLDAARSLAGGWLRRHAGPACLVLGLFGCARPAAAPPAAPSPGAAPAAAAPAPATSADAAVNSMLRSVAELRQLAPLAPVKGRVIDRKEMIDRVRAELRSELPPEVIRANETLLVLLGVVGADFDYERSVLGLMTSQLAGFYQPDDKTMYLAADLGRAESDATLSHELVHALQDQHYDLAPRIKYRDDASDEQAAIHALAEGDATSAMIDQQLASRGVRAIDIEDRMIEVETRAMIEMSADTAGIPRILKRSVIAPYIDGILFVHWARRLGGWAKVDEIWKRPPVTTEQLLHPEKYLKNEVGEAVPVPPAPPGRALRLVYHDIFGEQALRLMLEEWLPRRSAELAAEGWNGDRVGVFSSGDEQAAAWHLRFDDDAAAGRAAAAFARGFSHSGTGLAGPLSDKHATALAAGEFCVERATLGAATVRRHRRDVLITLGPALRSAGTARSLGSCRDALVWSKVVSL